jgi:hypothetical protein
MLSAAAAALLTAAMAVVAARADTTISAGNSTEVTTANAGNIVIDATGGVSIKKNGVAAVTINSNNSVINNGGIANAGIDGGVAVVIDTTAGNLVNTTGFASTGTIDVGGTGSGKRGIALQGGNTFYGPISLTNLNAVTLTGSIVTTQVSSMIVQGDDSAALVIFQGTKMTGNILLGGGGILQSASPNSTASNSIMVDLEGTLNGNLIIQSALNGFGPGITGVQTLGGIHSCASDTGAPSGFTCPTSSGGSLVNVGTISLVGSQIYNSRGNPEAGSALVIGGSVDGGFLNSGPGTSNNITSASISSSGVVASNVSQPVVLIDPTRSIIGAMTVPAGPVVIGPVTADVDGIDPGYSFINRGTIHAQPTDAERGTAAVVIQGASSTYFTCLGTVSSSVCNLTGGGLLNTGTISAQAVTNSQTVTASGVTSATGLYIGAYTTVPRLDIKAETITSGSHTSATISAAVNGIGQGNARGVFIDIGANVPVVNVSQNANILASVSTNTNAPTKEIAGTNGFNLVSQALVDRSGTLKTINNAGTIQAQNTILIPGVGARTTSITTAIDLSAGTTGGVTVNNSGRILGNVLMGSVGNGNTLNVGNTGAGGTAANPSIVPSVANTAANYAIVAQSISSTTTGFAPLTLPTFIDFGAGSGHTLHVGGFGYVNAAINSSENVGSGALAVQVDSNGQLFIANTTTSLQASTFNVSANGTLGLAISQSNLNSLTPVVKADTANISSANLALQFGSYISSGFTAAATAAPSVQNITLISAVHGITDSVSSIATQNALLGQNTPFLFETPAESGITPLTINTDASGQSLLLRLLPRSTGATNKDGSPGLNLSGQAQAQFPFAARALATDNELGATIATSMTVYNTPGVPGSGINIAASQQQAQQVFSQFAPDVSGGTREIAILLTDQASGPVAARQRLLRSYANVAGDMTLWGQEFTGQIANRGRVASDGTLTSYKDHGFGFTLGVDGGSPRNGWYGGAFTFYSGDVTQQLPRSTRTNTQWYMLTGYTDWRGKHVFIDTQISAAYGNFEGTRVLSVGGLQRTATSRRPGAMLALGGNTGVVLKYKGFEVDPHISLDAMTLREEGYQEANGGPGFNLDVAPYFASSVRTALGADIKTNITIWNFVLTPEARLGYRYDLLQDAVKIKAAFQSTGGRATVGNTMTFVGPDPDRGNAILGLSLGAGTDTWHLGVNYDWVRGDNGSTTQVGMITVLGRI